MNPCWPSSNSRSASPRFKTRRNSKPGVIVPYRDSLHVYRFPELDAWEWLVHGFGTKLSDIPARFANLAMLRQIHSAACVPAEGRSGVLGEGDALLENSPGSVVAVRTADCIPVLLVDERRRAVAA